MDDEGMKSNNNKFCSDNQLCIPRKSLDHEDDEKR